MPKIAAYHPVIKITNGSQSEFIELDLDDYYPEKDVRQTLQENTGARTGGGAVEVLKKASNHPRCKNGICLGIRILNNNAEPTIDIKWDEGIV